MLSTISAVTILATASMTGWLPTGFRWNPGQFPIPYCLSANATRTSLTQAQVRAEMTEAINYWRSSGAGGGLSCSTYDAAASAASCTARVDSNDSQNNIFFNRNWQHGSQTLGVTWSGGFGNCGSVTDDTGRSHSLTCQNSPDIELNDANLTWDAGGRGSNTDIASILSHEYGHFIGLDHCNDNNTCNFGSAIMYAAYGGGEWKVPQPDDVQGACALYPGTPGGVGYPCANNGTCTSNQCISPGANGYCTAACGTCPVGFACTAHPSFPSGNVCVRDDGTNKATCEICNGGAPNACANNGICLSGIPEQNTGRCAPPCPNPGATDGGCPNLFTCAQVSLGGGNTGYYCIPRSSDCTDLNNIVELQFGQTCTGNPPCASGLDCVEICTRTCTGRPGQGDCPAGFACDTFNFTTGPEDYCAPPVNEGQDCSGFKACPTGPCLRTGSGNPICYRDCAGNPSACNNAQVCNTYQLSGGGTVSVCEPPGVPPRPDGGVTDTGSPPTGDGGPLLPDATAIDPDGGPGPGDPDAGAGQTCTCDQFFYCEPGCDCDQECPCTCDKTFGCDQSCTCDPECYEGGNAQPKDRVGGGCNCATGEPDPTGVSLIALATLAALLRRRQATSRRR